MSKKDCIIVLVLAVVAVAGIMLGDLIHPNEEVSRDYHDGGYTVTYEDGSTTEFDSLPWFR